MTQPTPQQIWTGAVASGTYRLIDLGVGASPRFGLVQQQGPNAVGERWWIDVMLPLADALEAAFSALYKP